MKKKERGTGNLTKNDSDEKVFEIPVTGISDSRQEPNFEHEIETVNEPEAAEELTEEKTDEKDAKIAELEETVKRLYADFDNFRKRKEEEVASSRKYAVERIVIEIVPVIDNFERAISASEQSKNYDALKEGLQMVHKQLWNVLLKEGVSEIDCIGQPLNPEEHQVMQCEESDEHEDDTILKELLKGYKLHDRVVRPSMVVVAKKSSV